MLNIIFDMDGTLIDSENAICAAINAIRKDRNLPRLENDYIKQVLHTPNLNCPKIFYELDNFAYPSYKVGFEKYFHKAYEQDVKVFDGVLWLLDECKKRNYFLAIASNAPHNELLPILHHHKIAHFFDTIIGSTPNRESKPSPMMIDMILQSAPFVKSIFVGNGAKDEGAAKNANIPYLHAKWGENPASLKPNEFCTAKGLLKLIEKRGNK